GIRTHRQPTILHALDRVDLDVRDDREMVPSLSQHIDYTADFAHLEIAGLVDRMAEKQIAGKHGDTDQTSDARAPGPRGDLGEKDVEPLRGQLIVDELLAVAMRPQHVPAPTGVSLPADRSRTIVRCQGFAPFGWPPLPRAHPIRVSSDSAAGS